jgi:hypothetical protein
LANRKIPLGFATWHDYNVYRVEKAKDLGYSSSQALGKPRKGERSISTLRAQNPSRDLTPVYTGSDSVRDIGGVDLGPGHIFTRWEGAHDYAGAAREFDRLGLSSNYATIIQGEWDDEAMEWDYDIYFFDQSGH